MKENALWQVYKAKKKEDAALILSRVSAATDSGLAQQTLAAWCRGRSERFNWFFFKKALQTA